MSFFRICQMAYLATSHRIKIGAFSVNLSENIEIADKEHLITTGKRRVQV